MLRRFGLLCLLICFAFPVFAQDTTPPLVRDAAINAAQAVLGSRPSTWGFSLLPATSNSNLGCLLVTGQPMAQSVTPYRVELTYPNGIYIVHVSADGSLVQLCDAKFSTATTGATPTPSPATAACTAKPVATLSVYEGPSNETTVISTLQANRDYQLVGKTNSNTWLQVTFGEITGQTTAVTRIGWVEISSVQVSAPCLNTAKLTGYINPDFTQGDCFVQAFSAFSNVRATPTANGELVAQIFENNVYQATAINSTQEWHFIGGGWVNDTVIKTFGQCNNLPQADNLTGRGFVESTISSGSANVANTLFAAADAMQRLACTANLEGYLPPRVQKGTGTASIDQGGVPNTLRSYPSVDDTVGQRIGTIQPGRTLDRVIEGPACNQGIVWWFVEIDGAQGWTAESNGATGDYYMVALGASTVSNPTPANPPASATVVSDFVTSSTPLSEIRLGEGEILSTLIFAPDASGFYGLGSGQGFGTGRSWFFGFWNLAGEEVSRTNLAGEGFGLDYLTGVNGLAVGTLDGTVTIYNSATNTPLQAMSAVYSRPPQFVPDYDISSSGRVLAVGRCADATCTNRELALLDIATSTLRWSADLANAEVRDVKISPDESSVGVILGTSIRFYNLSSGQLIGEYRNGNGLPMNTLVFNPTSNGQALYSGCNAGQFTCEQGAVGLLNSSNATLLGTVPTHASEAFDVTYSPDGTRFISYTMNGEIILRSGTTGDAIQTLTVNDMIADAIFSPDGRSLYVSIFGGSVLVYPLPQ